METKKTDDRLAFAVRLATINLDGLRPGDWLNLRDDLAAFLGLGQVRSGEESGGITTSPLLGPPNIYEYPEESFKELQLETREILESIVRRKIPEPVASEPKRFPTAGLTLVPHGDTTHLIVSGSVRDAFLLNMFFLLMREPSNKILSCPECSTLFCRQVRQKYCSRDCANRASVKRWRRKKKTKKKREKKGS